MGIIGTAPNKSYQRSDNDRTGLAVCVQERDDAGLNNTAELCDNRENDLAGAINVMLMKDGGNAPTANLPMAGFKHTGAAAADGTGQYMRFDEVTAGYQPLDDTLTGLADVTTAADELIYATGVDEFDTTSLTEFGRSLIDDADQATAQATLGLGDLLNSIKKQAVTASSSSLAIDMSLGWNVALSLGATVTGFTVSNWPATGTMGRLTLEISNTGAFNISDWPDTTIWGNGNAPTVTSGSGKKDTIVITSNDGGTNFRGYFASQNMS